MTAIWIILGIATWPAMEYTLHRFLGHQWKVKTLFRKEHQTHHAVKDFFAPAYYKAIAAIAVIGAMVLFRAPIIYAFSFTAMYLFYEWTHYSFHRYPPKTKWGAKMRKHHFAHHYMNANKNFGVTLPWFDHVFNSALPSDKKVKVPKSFAMQWLVDGQFEVKPEFKNDYFI